MRPDITVAELSYADNQWQRRHAHEETTVSIVLAGALLERVARTEELARPLSIVVKPGGTEHEDRFGPRGARILQIRLSSEAAARLRQWQSQLDRWRWIHTGPVPTFLNVLWLARRTDPSADGIADAAMEAIAALSGDCDESHRCPPGWLRLVREEIDDSPARGLRVRALAHAADVHPVHLAREFRRYFGVSVTEYMQRGRVRRAAELLADPRSSLSLVSYVAGYADQSHFCRIFKRETGMTPLAFRRIVVADPKTKR